MSPTSSGTELARALAARLRVRRGLRRADPGAQLVGAGLTNRSWIDLYAVYAAGGRRFFDIAAAHPFSARVSNVVKIVGLVRGEMARAGDARKPLLVTELSWTSGRGRATLSYGGETTESGQAARVRRPDEPGRGGRPVSDRGAVLVHVAVTGDRRGLRRLNARGRPVSKPALRAFRAIARRLAS
jgi:hypothetical protein